MEIINVNMATSKSLKRKTCVIPKTAKYRKRRFLRKKIQLPQN